MLLPLHHRTAQRRSSRAYTLIELVMVMVIVGIVGSTAATAAVESARIYSRSLPRMDAAYQVEFVLANLRDDLRAMRSDGGLGDVERHLLSFKTADDQTWVYRYDGGDLTRNGHLLGTGLADFDFRYRVVDGTFTSDAGAVHLIEVDFVVVRGSEKHPAYATIFPRAVTR